MEEVTEKKKGRGGARAGSGRKRSKFPRKCRTVYCDGEEIKLLKAVLQEIRRKDAAQTEYEKAIAAISDEDEKFHLMKHMLAVKADVEGKTLAQLIEDSGAML